MDQTEKKQTTSSTAVEDGVKERNGRGYSVCPAGFWFPLKDICQDSPAGPTPGLGPPGPLKEEKKESDTEPGARDVPVLPGGGGARTYSWLNGRRRSRR